MLDFQCKHIYSKFKKATTLTEGVAVEYPIIEISGFDFNKVFPSAQPERQLADGIKTFNCFSFF